MKTKLKPKFKVGDIIVHDLDYAKVLFLVEAIGDKMDKYYDLKGLYILSSDGTNPHMTEAKSYQPFVWFLDSTSARLVHRPGKRIRYRPLNWPSDKAVTLREENPDVRGNSQTVKLGEEETNDLLSAISFTTREHPKDSPGFLRSLKKLDKKLWGVVRKF